MILVGSGLVQQGMFMDGIQYACVSKNLAEGYGSFWFPFLSPFWCQNGAFHFFEHPPLFYFLESLLFRISAFKDYAEQLFCALMWLLNAWCIHRLWKLVHAGSSQRRQQGWLPVLLWTVTPVCFWCFCNNMVEIAVSFFVLSAVYFILRFLLSSPRKPYAYLVLAGALIYAGFLTKGLVALFPLATCLAYWVAQRRIRFGQALWYTAVLLLVSGGLFLLVFLLNPSACYMLQFYFRERFVSRLADTATTANRFEILFDLLSQLLPMLGIALCAFLVQRFRRRIPARKEGSGWLWFFVLMGLCGSLPIMLTLVQKGFYFMPSLGFYALGLALLILGWFRDLRLRTEAAWYKALRIGSCVLALASAGWCLHLAGSYSRDGALLKEVRETGLQLQEQGTINSDMEVYCTWNYQFYLQRYCRLYLDPTKTYRRYLMVKNSEATPGLHRYRFVREYPSGFRLYEKKPSRLYEI